MGSKGNSVQSQGSQSQTYTPTRAIKATGDTALQGATSAYNLPFQMPVAPVAPFTDFQNQSFNEIQGLQGFAQPYFNTGAGLLGGSAAPVTSQDVAQYYNPMAGNITAQMQNIFGQQDVQNTGSLQQAAGGVGADRIAIGQGNLANQQALAAGQTYAGLYQSALQAAQQQKQMMAGAGYGIGQMGPAALAAQQNEVNQLLGAGGMQQQLAQAQQNAAYQQRLAQIAFPYQDPQYLAGITAGLAPALGGTTSGQYSNQTTYPTPSPLAQGLGVGTSLLGFGGMFGGFGGGAGKGSGAPMQWMPNYGPGAYGNGNSYPMFDSGGAVTGDYGDLADKMKLQEYGQLGSAAARGNPLAAEIAPELEDTQNYDDGGGIPDQTPMQVPGGQTPIGYLTPGANPHVSVSNVIPQSQLPSGQGGHSALPYGQQMYMQQPSMGKPQQQSGSSGGMNLGQLAGSIGNLGTSIGSLFSGGAEAGDAAVAADAALALANRGGRMADGGPTQQQKRDALSHELLRREYLRQHLDPIGANQPYNDDITAGQERRQGLPGEFKFKNLEEGMENSLQQNGPMEFLSGGKGPPFAETPDTHHIAGGGAVNPMSAGQGFGEDDLDYVPPTGPQTPMLRPDFLPPSVPMSDAPPGSVPEMGLGEAGVKDQGRAPGMYPGAAAATSPYVNPDIPNRNDAAKAQFDNVPLPRPNPLGGLTPEMREKFPALRSAAADRGVEFDIGEGYRSQERQNQLYAQGRLTPGPVVTDAPISNHTRGNAIDVVPINGTTEEQVGSTVSDLTRNDPRFADMRSGATFRSLHDPLHVELPNNQEARTPGGAPINAGPPNPMGGIPYSQMMAGAPYPDALKRDWGQNAARSPWMAVVKAGAAMASTPGPIGTVLAHGIGAGAGELDAQRKELRGEEGVNQKAQALYQHAEQLRQTAQYRQDTLDIRRQNASERLERLSGVPASTIEAMRKDITSKYTTPGLEPTEEQRQHIEDELEREVMKTSDQMRRSRQPGNAPAPANPAAPTSQLPPGVPPGSIAGKKDGVRGYQTPDGQFIPVAPPTG